MPINFQQSGSDIDSRFIRKEFFQIGNLWTWGSNGAGQLGDNTTTKRSSPVQTIAGGINWETVGGVGGGSNANDGATVGAIKADGTLWMWGDADYGILGDNTRTDKSSPVQTVAAGTNWTQVSVGTYFHTVAIKTDGTLWSWGLNQNGSVGDGSSTQRSSPVQTSSGGNNWKQASAGQAATVAIKTDGTLWTWGSGSDGQLGDGTTTSKNAPGQVGSNTNWKQVSNNYYASAAVKTDGTLWVWGANLDGVLGTNNLTNYSSPVQTVAGGTNWNQVSVGKRFMCAIKTDGTLWGWGINTSYQLGDNTSTSRSSPVQTVSGGTNWKQVSAGTTHASAVKTDGTLWSWGVGSSGQLGNNGIDSVSSPVQTIAGGTKWKSVAAGYRQVIAISYIN
jgi:alpha-tubulin suppressor-like RCC1 family protein